MKSHQILKTVGAAAVALATVSVLAQQQPQAQPAQQPAQTQPPAPAPADAHAGHDHAAQPAAAQAGAPATQPAGTVDAKAAPVVAQVKAAYDKLQSLDLNGHISANFDVAGNAKKEEADF